MARHDPETQLQIAAVNLLRYVLPVGAVVHHSHNEGKRSKRDAGQAKAMGQRAGFADLVIFYKSTTYFIEFKAPADRAAERRAGRQTKEQKQFEADLAATGFPHYAIVTSIEELVGVLRAWDLMARRVGNFAAIPDPEAKRD